MGNELFLGKYECLLFLQMRTRLQICENKKRQHRFAMKFFDPLHVSQRGKSSRGIQFRIWANEVIKDYLLKGYAVNNRMNRMEDNLERLIQKSKHSFRTANASRSIRR